MINDISDWFTKLLIKLKVLKQEQYSNFDFYFRIVLFNSLIIIPLVTFSIFLDIFRELIVVSLSVNLIRIFSGGEHKESLEACVLYTVPFVTLVTFLSKYTVEYTNYISLICIGLGIYIIKFIPQIKEKIKTDEYYRNGYIITFLCLYIIGITGMFYNQLWIINSVNMSVIAVAITLKDLKLVFKK